MAELVDATDSKSVELRFMSVRVGLGVPLSENKVLKINVTCVTFHFFPLKIIGTGDGVEASELAIVKGEKEAVRKAMDVKGCEK